MRRWRDTPRESGAWVVAAVVLATAATFGSAQARPFEVEDLLQREGFGEVAIAPGGRWLVVEQRRPLAAGSRFDFGRFNTLFRTDVKIADLAAGTGLRVLLSAEAGVGYRVGPVSPDGARMIVFRLTPERWELGIAVLASGAVHWTGVTPEIADETRSLQWLSADRLAVIATAPGVVPFELRAVRPQERSPALWSAVARGDVAVTSVGSGRYLNDRPHDPSKRLIVLLASTGAVETLAEGDFTDLEASPSGRRLALVEAAEDIPLKSGRQVQGDYGIAVRRMRLRILDLATGAISAPCPACDTLSSLLAWSTDGELLAYVRQDGDAWRDGRLVRIDANGRLTTAAPGLRPAISGRPERLAAGWWGRDVLVFGREAGGIRDDWWRIGPRGRTILTAKLPRPAAGGPAVSRDALLALSQDGAWRIGRDGRVQRIADGFTRLPRRAEGIPDRTQFALGRGPLAGVLSTAEGARAALFAPNGRVQHVAPVNIGERVFAATPSGAVLNVVAGGGTQTLAWRRVGVPDEVLARINARLADVDRPSVIPVAHAGPNGEALRSWLFLPPHTAVPPPLVVVPYPGAVHAEAPDSISEAPAMAPAAALVGHGYAVLVPSLPTWRGGEGPADGLANRVLEIVEAAAHAPATAGRFDPSRLGLWGHSFGGYATAAILTQTDRFAAAVATAAPTDLASFHGQFSPFRRMNPEEGLSTPWTIGWTETLQGDMRAPPWASPERYRRNSPLMQADRITTPLLLAYGELDGAHPGQAEALFSALVRQDKDAILLTYWGEGHLFGSPGNIRDLYQRAFAFLDAHLMTPGSDAAPKGRPAPASASSEPRTPAPPRR